MYILIGKCGQVDKKVSFYFMFSFCYVPFTILTKSVDRWTSNENSEKNSFILMYILIWNCRDVDKKVSFYFMYSFCYVPFKILTKSVDRWTSNENSGKKVSIPLYFIA